MMVLSVHKRDSDGVRGLLEFSPPRGRPLKPTGEAKTSDRFRTASRAPDTVTVLEPAHSLSRLPARERVGLVHSTKRVLRSCRDIRPWWN